MTSDTWVSSDGAELFVRRSGGGRHAATLLALPSVPGLSHEALRALDVLASPALTNAPRLWAGWAAEHSLLDTSALGLWAVPLAAVLGNVIGYGWHRLRHSVPLLWRFHQTHHSAERLDVSSAFMFHPVETMAVAFLGSLSSTMILGVSPEAAALGGAVGFYCAAFTHANIRTPRWLGYILTRPESHSLHHERGVHAGNYADIPIVDMLFGTFKNPAERPAEFGFYDGSARRVGRMLIALDNTRSASS